MARKDLTRIVLQCTPRFLSFARVSGRGEGVTVRDSALERGDWSEDPAALQTALAEFVQRHEIRDEPVYVVLPRYEAVLRILEFPSQSPDELAGMVELSAQDIVPYPSDDILARHVVLEHVPGGAARLLVVVVRRSVVNEHLAAFAAAGIQADHILLSTTCLLTGLASLPDGAKDGAVLHVAPDYVEIVITRDGAMAFGRCATLDVAGEPDRITSIALEDIASETRSSLSTYAREVETDTVKPRLVLSADGFDPEALARALIDERDLPVVPASSLMWSLLEHGAARIATGDTRFALDLMPESEKTRRQALTNRSRIIRAAAAVGVALLATVAVYFQQVAQRQRYLDQLETRAAQLRPVATTLRTKRMQLNVIEDQIDRSQSPLGMMATFAQLAPESGLNVQRISFDRDDRFLVAGSAVETSVFEKLIDDLRAEGSKTFEAFSRAQEVYRTQRTERGQRVWDFGINVPLVEEPAP